MELGIDLSVSFRLLYDSQTTEAKRGATSETCFAALTPSMAVGSKEGIDGVTQPPDQSIVLFLNYSVKRSMCMDLWNWKALGNRDSFVCQ